MKLKKPLIVAIGILGISASVAYGVIDNDKAPDPKQSSITSTETKTSSTQDITTPKTSTNTTDSATAKSTTTKTTLSSSTTQPAPSTDATLATETVTTTTTITLPPPPVANYNLLERSAVEAFLANLNQQNPNLTKQEKTQYFIQWCQSANYPQAIIDRWVKDNILATIPGY